jgi:hypothetical protein
MADDERPDARDEARDEQVSQWLEVEPLDDVTRRRLVAPALRESATSATAARSSRVWAWVAAAAAAVVVLVVGLTALNTSGGGDSEVATRTERTAPSPKAVVATTDVGDYGDLDDPANLAALRAALGRPTSGATASQAAGEAESSPFSSSAGSPVADRDQALRLCGLTVPDGATAVAQGTGTIDGRRATVVLVEDADGTRSVDAVLEDPCEVRRLP